MIGSHRVRRCPWALLALAAGAALAGGHPLDAPTKQWRQGPPRYLLTTWEDAAFKRLADDRARAEFIAAFWKRRDPTPETDRNEFRETFWDRVDRTDSLRLYFESTKPMWLTDPGKWYVLLGPPQEEQRDQVATSTRDTVIWTYRDVPGISEPSFSLVFVADEGGEMRLTQTPSLDQKAWGQIQGTPLVLQGPGAARSPDANPMVGPALARQSDALYGTVGSPTQTTLLQRMTTTSDHAIQAIGGQPASEAEVRTEASFDPLPIEVRPDFYRADDGTTYTAFTIGATPPPGPDDDLAPFGGIVSLDDAAVSYPLAGTDQFAAAGPEAPATFQTGLGLDPGRYRVMFGLQDRASGRVGTWKQDVTVPDLGGPTLTLSSLTLARELRPAGDAAPMSALKVPFLLGSLRVVPRIDARLRNGDEFHLYYQIYGAARPDGAEPSLVAAYRFEGRAGDEWVPIGAPIEQADLTQEVQAWSFPLRGWPPGAFRLSVTVTDRHSGHSAQGSIEFAVVE